MNESVLLSGKYVRTNGQIVFVAVNEFKRQHGRWFLSRFCCFVYSCAQRGMCAVYAGLKFSQHFRCFHWLLNGDRVFLSVWKL